MNKYFQCLLVILSGCFLLPFLSNAQLPIVIENRLELFIDSHIMEKFEEMEVRLGTPVSGGIALKFNEPWERRFSGGYVSVLTDGKLFRIYYRGEGEGQGAPGQVTCYAESKDGIHWVKPKLGLFKVKGSANNNVVMKGNHQQSTHNLSVLFDARTGVPDDERFKAVGGVASSIRPGRGLYRYVSADGIHWKRYKDSTALFIDGYGMDSQNVLAWLPEENLYAIYLRTWTGDKPGDKTLLKGMRTIARSVSEDFIHWSEPVPMQFGDSPAENLYTNATQPYFRAPHILISMPFRFSPDSKVLSDKEMESMDIDKTMWKGVSDAVLMSSRGGNIYERKFLESFVRPGNDQRNWAARSTIPALGIIPTGQNEISFFLTRAYGTSDCYLERMKLRVDGFASLHTGYIEGAGISKPVVLRGKNFKINYSASSIGYIYVVLLDETGKEIEGFGRADAHKLMGDKIDADVKWKSGKTISDIGDKPVRIKFISRDADIYSFVVGEK
jgi:hypothetical protein